jgi:hypothetical protein
VLGLRANLDRGLKMTRSSQWKPCGNCRELWRAGRQIFDFCGPFFFPK